MTTGNVVALMMCLLALAGNAITTVSFTEDAVCALQTAVTAEDRLIVQHSSARGLLQSRVVLRDGPAEVASEEGRPKGGDKDEANDKGKGKGKKGKGEDEESSGEVKEGKGEGKGGKGSKDKEGKGEGKEGKEGKGEGKGGKGGKDKEDKGEGKGGKGGKDKEGKSEGKEVKEGKGEGKGGKGGKNKEDKGEGKGGKGGKDKEGKGEGKEVKEGKGEGKGGKGGKDKEGKGEGKEDKESKGEGGGKGGKDKEDKGEGKGGKGGEDKEGKGGKDKEGKGGKDKEGKGEGKGGKGKGGKGKGNDEEVPSPTPTASGPPAEPDYCEGQIQMDMDRTVLTNNLGGLGPTGGKPVIHIQKFVDLMDGRTVDLVVANLTEYGSNNPAINGLNGEFNNVNIKAGFVDLTFTFVDTMTQDPMVMPPFNMTVYDLDGPGRDVYAETVAIDRDDFTSFKLTDSTQVIMTETSSKTEFGSSALGEACDNPSSISTVGVVVCKNSGTVDQRDRAVALQMKGGKSSYHITLRASDAVKSGRNFLFGTPAYFDKVCHSPTLSPTLAPTGTPTLAATPIPTATPTYSPTTSPTGSPSSSPTLSPSASPTPSPSLAPTSSPTYSPSYSPTSSPTGSPSFSPTSSPTESPSYSPTSSPTGSPSNSPTTSPSSSPTSSPSYSPTSSPTGSPSYSPTTSPTGSPTGSPTSSPSYSPTSSPSGSPSYSPTMSPSSSPTFSPSYSPTTSPTGSPSSSPTMSPSSSPTLSPSYSPTFYPTGSPTSSPTVSRSSPTELPHNVATSFGDPHVSNLKGERFDILQTDYHTFLVIPRGADEKHSLLHVVAKVDPLGQLCSGLLYVTSLRFSGRWVGDVGSLEFTTNVHAAMEAENAMKIKAGASSYLNASQFREVVPQSLAEVTEFQAQVPQRLNQHVDLLLVKLKLGPSIAKVRMVYQKEKVGFSNSLWLTTTGLGHVHDEIGGILGFDDHAFAASKPKKCVEPDEGDASALLGFPTPHGSVHASASLEDVDG